MKSFLIWFLLCLSSLAIFLAAKSSLAMPRQISADDNKLRVWATGTGSPTVVFDSFGLANLEMWSRVQPEVAKFTSTFSYDHGGYWGSEPGPKPRDAQQLAFELRIALRRAGLAPPYLLVGYSMGGPYARVFAGNYPEEIAGIVLVDPTQEEFMDWLKERYPRLNTISDKNRLEQDEAGSVWLSLEQAREARLPRIPMTLITGMKPHDMFTRKYLPRWLDAHRTWLEQFPHAKHIITANSGHEVVLSDPYLVVTAIREMLDELRGGESMPLKR
jgi:pimeloyl-ACP methyl ester carboxylesterase